MPKILNTASRIKEKRNFEVIASMDRNTRDNNHTYTNDQFSNIIKKNFTWATGNRTREARLTVGYVAVLNAERDCSPSLTKMGRKRFFHVVRNIFVENISRNSICLTVSLSKKQLQTTACLLLQILFEFINFKLTERDNTARVILTLNGGKNSIKDSTVVF